MNKNLSLVKNNYEELPNNIEAEQSVLGSILLQNEIFDDISTLITSINFYDPLHQRIFAAIENLIYISWNNKILGLIFGLINGIMICSLIISITQDIITASFNLHEYWINQSNLYHYLDILQKKYLIQYSVNG